ncbi:MAG: DUF2087 domain-containing protein [Oscillospiraceae bacterium]|nr:DUF2087 domain-containing protein [Oscillospiraceae bacterium]
MINRLDATIEEIKQGYVQDDRVISCLFCKQQYQKGDIYRFSERLVDANGAIQQHLIESHISVFDVLASEDKKLTGLTITQKEYLSYFYVGISDREIADETNTVPSTVRYQRYSLKEKAKQARVFLAIYELMEEKQRGQTNTKNQSIPTSVRHNTTEEESYRIIENFFSSMKPLVLKTFSSKEKKKLVILQVIAEQFEKERRYTEKEVNDILKAIYDDYVTLRRYLIEYGFMERTQDCSEYWLK